MDAFLAECTKTLSIDSVVAFQTGIVYQWDWSDEDELEDGFGEYCFKSEICEKHFMSHSDVEEFFV